MSYTEEYTKKTLRKLTAIFNKYLQMMTLHHYMTEAKMMKMLRQESSEDWKTEYILDLSKNNKIEWVRGIDDPQPPDVYQKAMNDTLTEILQTGSN